MLHVMDPPVPWDGDAHTPNSDRSLATTRTRIGAQGTLISISVAIVSGVPRVGQVHVRLVLEDEQQREKATLCMGYIYPGHEIFGAGGLVVRGGDGIRLESRSSVASIILQPRGTVLRGSMHPAGWAGVIKGSLEGPGALRTITGTNPAAGAEVSETVPTNARWRLIAVRLALATDATAVNRRPELLLDDGTSTYQRNPSGTVQTASLTRNYDFAKDLADATAFRDVDATTPTSEALLLQAYRFRTITESIVAGDNYEAPVYEVEEWIEE